jgi:hypothetical protein
VVAPDSAGHIPAKGEDEQVAARVFYMAATRAMQRWVIGVGGKEVGRRMNTAKNRNRKLAEW